jgi:nucleotide-binding universal stress UspA family protein
MNGPRSGSPSTTKLLVGFDGSDDGRDALTFAKALASTSGVTALVVTLLPYGPFPVGFEELEDQAAAKAEPLLEEAHEYLTGLTVETRVSGGGSPAWVMTHLAEEEDIDTIVVGSPHRGAIGRALIESVAESLLHGAPFQAWQRPPICGADSASLHGVAGTRPLPHEPEKILEKAPMLSTRSSR